MHRFGAELTMAAERLLHVYEESRHLLQWTLGLQQQRRRRRKLFVVKAEVAVIASVSLQ